MLVTRILEIVVPIFAVVAVGIGYGRLRRPAMDAANRVNLEVFVPALVFSSLSKESFDIKTYGALALGGVVIVLGSGLAAWALARSAAIAAKTLAPPMMFRNAGNMGLPLLVLAFGDAALPGALVLFLLGNLAQFSLGTYLLDRRGDVLSVLRQPAILAALAALAVSFAGVSIPKPLALPLEMLGRMAVPLMLFALGVRLIEIDLRQWRIGLLGAVLAPAVGLALVALVFLVVDLPKLQAGCLFLFAVLPPAVLNFLFAERYNQEPARVASIVMLGNLATVVTIPLALAYALPHFG